MAIKLYDYQKKAVEQMKNGCILCGGVGSGKSRTALAYYFKTQGGDLYSDKYKKIKGFVKDLYIITTARKRDTLEWEKELLPFHLSTGFDNLYSNMVIVDSWNNIGKYAQVKDCFFIFDEQRVVGSGAWVKAFLKIAKCNEWILLSATPGDTWLDYIPVFIANGFYRNRTEFNMEHVVYARFSKYPKVDKFINTGRLLRQRNDILVTMDFKRETVPHHENIYSEYDLNLYKTVMVKRWNPFTQEPINNATDLCLCLRRVVNADASRLAVLLEILEDHPKTIIFYNFDYELSLLKQCDFGTDVKVAEWNGHVHQKIPTGNKWVYLVQYSAGNEGWNCTETDTIIFYSLNYSYRVMTQAAGRIDRLNTPYKDLYFYHLKSRSGIDLAISRALRSKRTFNEKAFAEISH